MQCVERCLNDNIHSPANVSRLNANDETLPLATASAVAVNIVTEDAPTYTVYIVMRTDMLMSNGITSDSRCMNVTVTIAKVHR